MVEPNVKEGKGGLRDLNTLFWIAQYLQPPDSRRRASCGWRCSTAARCAPSCGPSTSCGRCAATCTSPPAGRGAADLRPAAGDRPADGLWRPRRRAGGRAVHAPLLPHRQGGRRADPGLLPPSWRPSRRSSAPHGPVALLAGAAAQAQAAGRAGLPRGGRPAQRRGPGDLRAGPGQPAPAVPASPTSATSTCTPTPSPPCTRSLQPDHARGAARPGGGQGLPRHPGARPATRYRTLTLMNEAGVLGRFLPEFGRIVAQMQFNMYHSYTVDEHTLRAVGVIADIAAGRLAEDHPLSAAGHAADRRPRGPVPGHAAARHRQGRGGRPGGGRRHARRARPASGWAWSRAKIELVAWLVRAPPGDERLRPEARRRATRARSPTSPSIVESPERLRLLLVLTVADIRAVGPGRLERLEGPADARALRRHRGGVPRRPRLRRGRRAAPLPARTPPTTPASRWPRPTRPPRPGPTAMEDAYFTAFDDRPSWPSTPPWSRRPRREGGAAAAAKVGRRPQRHRGGGRRRATGRACSPTWPARSPAPGANVVGRAGLHLARRPGAGRLLRAGRHRRSPSAPDDPRALKQLLAAWRAAARGEPVQARAAPRRRPRPRRGLRHHAGGGARQRRLGDFHRGRGLGPRPAGPAGGAVARHRRRRPVDPVGPHRRLWRARGGRLLCPRRRGRASSTEAETKRLKAALRRGAGAARTPRRRHGQAQLQKARASAVR